MLLYVKAHGFAVRISAEQLESMSENHSICVVSPNYSAEFIVFFTLLLVYLKNYVQICRINICCYCLSNIFSSCC